MNLRNLCLPCLVALLLTGCSGGSSSSSTTGSQAANKAPVKLDKIQGKVQLQMQAAPSEAALNEGGPSVFLWEGVRRYRLYFKTRMDDVKPGEKYVAEGVWAQRVIDEIGDPDGGKNGYPLEASCQKVIKSVWPSQSFDSMDASVSTLKNAIKRYPARPVFLVTKFSPVEGAEKEKEDTTPEVNVPWDKQKAALKEGSLEQPAPLWAPDGGTAKCKIVIGKDGKVAELNSGNPMCEGMNWAQLSFTPAAKPGKIATEVEVKFVAKK